MLVQLAVANVVTFGNGIVMAAVLQNTFVQQRHVLTNEQLLYALSLARVTPLADARIPGAGNRLRRGNDLAERNRRVKSAVAQDLSRTLTFGSVVVKG